MTQPNKKKSIKHFCHQCSLNDQKPRVVVLLIVLEIIFIFHLWTPRLSIWSGTLGRHQQWCYMTKIYLVQIEIVCEFVKVYIIYQSEFIYTYTYLMTKSCKSIYLYIENSLFVHYQAMVFKNFNRIYNIYQILDSLYWHCSYKLYFVHFMTPMCLLH